MKAYKRFFGLVILILMIGFTFAIVQGNEMKLKGKDIKINDSVKKKYYFTASVDKIKGMSLQGKGFSKQDNDKIVVEFNSSEVDSFSKTNNIKLIEIPDYRIVDSMTIIQANTSWQLKYNGLNLTGANQTICVIDSGINYNHPDLGGCYGNNNASSSCKVLGGYDFVNNDNNPDDDNGHGTHVAGIVAANGTIRGVAPDAKLLALKACNATGSCSYANLDSAIKWCVGNSSLYNISIISMSVGGGAYTDYCNDDYLASSINSAVAKNISVVVATGNDGLIDAISSPACVQNATAVTSSNESDNAISMFANTWNNPAMINLAAPGENIYSTYLGTGYITESGTSMATPHVAGAIAILKQYLKANGLDKTPDEIENLLNNTGKIIDDSAYSGRNFTRISVYSALSSLDTQSPNVSLISPINGTGISGMFNQTFRCNASDLELKNVSFYLWNSTSVYNLSSRNVSGSENTFEINITNIPFGNWTWNCLYSDINNNRAFALRNNSIIVDLIPPILTILSPLNNSWQNAGRFNVGLDEVGTCWYSLNSGVYNYSMLGNASNSGFNATNSTLLQDARYNVSFYCNDTMGNRNSSSLITFRIDMTSPNVTLTEPFPGDETSSSASKIFYYNVSDNLNITRCDLISNGIVLASNSSAILNSTNNITSTFPAGTYTWSINCSDEAGNVGNSSSQVFTITAPASPPGNSGGGGGGGGGGTPKVASINVVSQVINSQEMIEGKTVSISGGSGGGASVVIELPVLQISNADEGIRFSPTSEIQNHSVTINSIVDNKVNITVRSDPINIILGVGESKKLNLTNPEYYDLYIKVEGIRNQTADLTIKAINEKISVSISENQTNQGIVEDKIARYLDILKNINPNWFVAILIFIFVIVVAIASRQKNRKKK